MFPCVTTGTTTNCEVRLEYIQDQRLGYACDITEGVAFTPTVITDLTDLSLENALQDDVPRHICFDPSLDGQTWYSRGGGYIAGSSGGYKGGVFQGVNDGHIDVVAPKILDGYEAKVTMQFGRPNWLKSISQIPQYKTTFVNGTPTPGVYNSGTTAGINVNIQNQGNNGWEVAGFSVLNVRILGDLDYENFNEDVAVSWNAATTGIQPVSGHLWVHNCDIRRHSDGEIDRSYSGDGRVTIACSTFGQSKNFGLGGALNSQRHDETIYGNVGAGYLDGRAPGLYYNANSDVLNNSFTGLMDSGISMGPGNVADVYARYNVIEGTPTTIVVSSGPTIYAMGNWTIGFANPTNPNYTGPWPLPAKSACYDNNMMTITDRTELETWLDSHAGCQPVPVVEFCEVK